MNRNSSSNNKRNANVLLKHKKNMSANVKVKAKDDKKAVGKIDKYMLKQGDHILLKSIKKKC